jgi:hypothetical protein
MKKVMSQIIACQNEERIVFASDSKTVDFDLQSNLEAISKIADHVQTHRLTSGISQLIFLN